MPEVIETQDDSADLAEFGLEPLADAGTSTRNLRLDNQAIAALQEFFPAKSLADSINAAAFYLIADSVDRKVDAAREQDKTALDAWLSDFAASQHEIANNQIALLRDIMAMLQKLTAPPAAQQEDRIGQILAGIDNLENGMHAVATALEGVTVQLDRMS